MLREHLVIITKGQQKLFRDYPFLNFFFLFSFKLHNIGCPTSSNQLQSVKANL